MNASIIIVTFNNLALTRQCLTSIYEKTDAPEFQVIVVDNGSSDGTPLFLEQFAQTHAHFSFKLNATNEGFAHANNQGAAIAQGESIVFLNNDTIVTRDWLIGLIRPLRDSQVGMVGPVTNSAGNESRIAVDYQDLTEMDQFAAKYTRAHADQSFEIPMLAFYCVALRRAVFEEIGPLDERFGIGMFEDDDYALRLKQKGYKILCVEDVFIHHWGSASFSKLGEQYPHLFLENLNKFQAKWQVQWYPQKLRSEFLQSKMGELVRSNIGLALELDGVKHTSTDMAKQLEHNRKMTARLSEQLDKNEQKLNLLKSENGYQTLTIQRLDSNLAEKEHAVLALNKELADIHFSTGWKLLLVLWRIRLFFLPSSSPQERWMRAVFQWFRNLKAGNSSPKTIAAPSMPVKTESPVQTIPEPVDSVSKPNLLVVENPTSEKYPGLVSVILPVYNQANLLRESIYSVLEQTYQNFELIIVNDGSTDNIETALAEFVGHAKIRLLTQTNQKLPNALSNGFEIARGEFWTWTSADNLMMPEQLEKQVAFLQAHPETAMVYADYIAIDDQGAPLADPGFRPQNRRAPTSPEIHLPRNVQALNTTQDNFIGACFMYRGWVGRLLGAYAPELGVEDYDYWMRINLSFKIEHLGTDDLLYKYRVHANTLNARAKELKIFERVQQLMTYEKTRAAFYNAPWIVYADAKTRAWLADLPNPPAVLPLEELGNANAHDKKVILLAADSLSNASIPGAIENGVTAIWFGEDTTAPYQFTAELRKIDICFTDNVLVAKHLELIHPQTFRVPPGTALWNILQAYGNNHLAMHNHYSQESLYRELPQPFFPVPRRLRVVLQVGDFNQGGLEQVVLDLAQCLNNEQIDVYLLVLGKPGIAAEQAQALGISVITLAEQDRNEQYKNFLTEQKIDLVNAHYSTFGADIAASLSIPFVQTIHNAYVWFSPDQTENYRKSDPYTSAYVAVSNNVAFYATHRLNLPPYKMVVMPNGIQLEQFESVSPAVERNRMRESLGLSAQDIVFLNVAAIYPPKAQQYMIRAFGKIHAECPNAKLVLVGRIMDQAYGDILNDEIKTSKLQDAIIFAGYQQETLPFYFMADAFLLPSFWEGWSLALAEAIYAHLPVIATDVGAARELLSQSTGHRLIELPCRRIIDMDSEKLNDYLAGNAPGFEQELAQAMRTIYQHPTRPTLPNAFQSLDWKRAYRKYARMFQWLAQRGSLPGATSWLGEEQHAPRIIDSEIQTGFQLEAGFWDKELSLQGEFAQSILDSANPERTNIRYPAYINPLIEQLAYNGKRPRVLDVGSGPFSMLAYGVQQNLFDLVAVDPLADQYILMMQKYNYYQTSTLIKGTGEELSKIFGANAFDFVWMQNAIDHSQHPEITFRELVQVLKPGGYLMVQGWTREASAQNWGGLHQSDFYLSTERDLVCESKTANGTIEKTIVNAGCPVTLIESSEPTTEPRQWIRTIWRKTPQL